jgi:putative membrane protein
METVCSRGGTPREQAVSAYVRIAVGTRAHEIALTPERLAMLRLTLAVIHLIGWAMALGSVFARARALHDVRDRATLNRGFMADNFWGIAALVLVSTGLWRALASTEKSSSYYWHSHAFYTKMALFGLVFALELWPMITLIRWRRAAASATLPEPDALHRTARRIARISDVQTLLLLGIVAAAAMMARGYGSG